MAVTPTQHGKVNTKATPVADAKQMKVEVGALKAEIATLRDRHETLVVAASVWGPASKQARAELQTVDRALAAKEQRLATLNDALFAAAMGY